MNIKYKVFTGLMLFVFMREASAVLQIDKINQTEEIIKTYPLYQQLNTKISEETFTKNFEAVRDKDYHFYKATLKADENTDVVVGLLGFQFIYQLYAGRYMHIDSFVIDEKHRRKGFGKELMQFASEIFEEDKQRNNCQDMRLETGILRMEAQAFYEKIGMIKYGVGYKYYGEKH